MPTQQELIEYIREAMKGGAGHQQIVEQLLQHNWAMADITAAFNAVYAPPRAVTPAPVPSVAPEPKPIAPPAVSSPERVVTSSQPAPSGTTFVSRPSPSPVFMPAATPPPKKGFSPPKRTMAIIGGVTFLVLIVGGVAYAYFEKLGPFAHPPYTEDNLFSGLLEQNSHMRSSTYEISAEVKVEPRDEGAEPFTLNVSNEGVLREQYQNDSTRAANITALLSGLQSRQGAYPKTLENLASSIRSSGSYYRTSLSTTDPVTKTPYGYRITEGGNNFALSVSFETTNAVSSLRRSYRFTEEGTLIDGTTVTFTKDSSPYFYLPTEPPKPFIVSLGEMMRMLPGEVRARLGITAASEWKTEGADWTFNADAEGDFGDLTYKVNVDALKKDKIYYFRINNLPSLFLGSLASVKGEWIKVDPATATSTSDLYRYNQFSSIATQFSSTEENYKKAREEWVEFLKKVVVFADEEKLAKFKNPPHSEKVDGRLLYRYDFETRKEAILPFYTKVVEEAGKSPQAAYADLFRDQGIIEYLKSEEFSQVYDYLNENVTQTLWVDPKGYLARLEYSMRIIPPDTAVQLADKQVRITWMLDLSDINKDVVIEEPEDARPVEEVIEETNTNRYGYDSGSATAVKSNLMSVRVQAELAYDKAGSSYGTQAFLLGACKETPKTLFAEPDIARSLKTAAGGDMSKATCASTKTAYAVSVPIPDLAGYSWCIDSTGASKQISSALSGAVCP